MGHRTLVCSLTLFTCAHFYMSLTSCIVSACVSGRPVSMGDLCHQEVCVSEGSVSQRGLCQRGAHVTKRPMSVGACVNVGPVSYS